MSLGNGGDLQPPPGLSEGIGSLISQGQQQQNQEQGNGWDNPNEGQNPGKPNP
jgi:hypothetical protein